MAKTGSETWMDNLVKALEVLRKHLCELESRIDAIEERVTRLEQES